MKWNYTKKEIYHQLENLTAICQKQAEELQQTNLLVKDLQKQVEAVPRLHEVAFGLQQLLDKFTYSNPEIQSLSPTNKRKILLCGFYGAPNLGDELML